MDSIIMLFQLTNVLRDLDMVQGWIDDARIASPTNQVVQETLDRKQEELDHKRTMINVIMTDIRSRN